MGVTPPRTWQDAAISISVGMSASSPGMSQGGSTHFHRNVDPLADRVRGLESEIRLLRIELGEKDAAAAAARCRLRGGREQLHSEHRRTCTSGL